MSRKSINARWFDGQQARALDVDLSMDGETLNIESPGLATRRYPRQQVTWPERTRHGTRQLILGDGGVVEVDDAAAWDAWAAQQRLGQPWAVRWAASWRSTVTASVVLMVVLVAIGGWGVPWAADHSARWVPQAVRSHLDRLVMAQLRERGWVTPSEYPTDTAAQLQAELARMLEAAYIASERPRIQLEVVGLPRWAGPNAFALPGGKIVVSDALLRALPGRGGHFHPGVLAVLAHEVGHVHGMHGLRNTLASSATGTLLGWWIGDYSALLAAAPALLVQTAYSRRFEREADDEALRILRASGVDPRGMVALFEVLKKEVPHRDGESAAFGLTTHPPDSERIRLFETGRR